MSRRARPRAAPAPYVSGPAFPAGPLPFQSQETRVTRRLTLARETLAELSADDLASVAGGQVTGRDGGWTTA